MLAFKTLVRACIDACTMQVSLFFNVSDVKGVPLYVRQIVIETFAKSRMMEV